jgi:hypothetical protein
VSVLLELIEALLVLSLPFMLGIAAGVEIVKRRKQTLVDAEAGLGRTINELIEQTTSPIRFTGPGVRVTRTITIARNGTECQLTFEAQS